MGSYEALPSNHIAEYEGARIRRDSLILTLRPIITKFLDSIHYAPPSKPDKDGLYTGMQTYAASSGVPYQDSKHARQCFMTGLSVAGVGVISNYYTLPALVLFSPVTCSLIGPDQMSST